MTRLGMCGIVELRENDAVRLQCVVLLTMLSLNAVAAITQCINIGTSRALLRGCTQPGKRVQKYTYRAFVIFQAAVKQPL
jgi:hypothetical protein